ARKPEFGTTYSNPSSSARFFSSVRTWGYKPNNRGLNVVFNSCATENGSYSVDDRSRMTSSGRFSATNRFSSPGPVPKKGSAPVCFANSIIRERRKRSEVAATSRKAFRSYFAKRVIQHFFLATGR